MSFHCYFILNDKNKDLVLLTFSCAFLESGRNKLFSVRDMDFRHVISKICTINLHVVYKMLLTTTDLDTL